MLKNNTLFKNSCDPVDNWYTLNYEYFNDKYVYSTLDTRVVGSNPDWIFHKKRTVFYKNEDESCVSASSSSWICNEKNSFYFMVCFSKLSFESVKNPFEEKHFST